MIEEKRNYLINDSKRWDDFRGRRIQAIDAYLAARKIMFNVTNLVKLIGFVTFMKKFQRKFDHERYLKRMRNNRFVLAASLVIRFRGFHRRFGKSNIIR
jgi:hypothetical protein